MNKILLYFAIKYNGDWDKIYSALKEKEQIAKEDLNRVINDVKYQFITILDNDYPEGFKEVYKPPFVLFYKGDKNILKLDNKIALVKDKEVKADDVVCLYNKTKNISNKQIIISDDLKAETIINNKVAISEFYNKRELTDENYLHLITRTIVGLNDKVFVENDTSMFNKSIWEYALEKNKLINIS
ncbi:DNA-processing protein DprA [Spiroplasma endosymbiont of Crioceris asparagi]|uniref:DNA-processing protein DprA n=1 Tax=Spiroplasma endosymbiont of Crioceris asparagi TaxID=3066286 RepID=UPI0030CAE83D